MCERQDRIKTAIYAVFDEHPGLQRVNAYTLFNAVCYKLKVTDPTEYGAYMQTFRELIKDPSDGFYAIKGRNGGIMRPTKTCACGMDERLCTIHTTKKAAPIQQQAQAVVDDYTCGCGNTKCSTKEKSCWRCGAPIQVKR